MTYVLLPNLPDPTDIVVQGDQSAAGLVAPTAPLALTQIVAGDQPFTWPQTLDVPTAVPGPHENYGIRPRQIGPMAMFGGAVVMLNLGPTTPVCPDVDKTQTWLYSQTPLDLTGELVNQIAITGGGFEPGQGMGVILDPGLAAQNPKAEVAMSRSGNPTMAPTIPVAYGQLTAVTPSGTTIRYYLSGTSRDSAGSPLASCTITVLRMETSPPYLGNIYSQAYIIEGTTTSDGSGNYTVNVSMGNLFQILFYKAGSPDVAGITVNNLTATGH